jgi:hypothetical protein
VICSIGWSDPVNCLINLAFALEIIIQRVGYLAGMLSEQNVKAGSLKVGVDQSNTLPGKG